MPESVRRLSTISENELRVAGNRDTGWGGKPPECRHGAVRRLRTAGAKVGGRHFSSVR